MISLKKIVSFVLALSITSTAFGLWDARKAEIYNRIDRFIYQLEREDPLKGERLIIFLDGFLAVYIDHYDSLPSEACAIDSFLRDPYQSFEEKQAGILKIMDDIQKKPKSMMLLKDLFKNLG